MSNLVQIHWGKFISDKLHEKIIAFPKTKCFYMSSYVIYSCDMRASKQRLKKIGTLGRQIGNSLIYAHLPQITIHRYKEH